jgi:hypothetical protein
MNKPFRLGTIFLLAGLAAAHGPETPFATSRNASDPAAGAASGPEGVPKSVRMSSSCARRLTRTGLATFGTKAC